MQFCDLSHVLNFFQDIDIFLLEHKWSLSWAEWSEVWAAKGGDAKELLRHRLYEH